MVLVQSLIADEWFGKTTNGRGVERERGRVEGGRKRERGRKRETERENTKFPL